MDLSDEKITVSKRKSTEFFIENAVWVVFILLVIPIVSLSYMAGKLTYDETSAFPVIPHSLNNLQSHLQTRAQGNSSGTDDVSNTISLREELALLGWNQQSSIGRIYEGLFRSTQAQFILSFVTILAIGAAAWISLQSLAASREALNFTKYEAKAHLFIDVDMSFKSDSTHAKKKIMLRPYIRNYGQTPALDVIAKFGISIVEGVPVEDDPAASRDGDFSTLAKDEKKYLEGFSGGGLVLDTFDAADAKQSITYSAFWEYSSMPSMRKEAWKADFVFQVLYNSSTDRWGHNVASIENDDLYFNEQENTARDRDAEVNEALDSLPGLRLRRVNLVKL